MLFVLWLLVGVLGRLIIHIPDVTPLTSLCLLASTVFSKRNAYWIMLSILLLSDFSLHILFHYPVFGLWTVFTYSVWLGIIVFGFLFSKKPTVLRGLWLTFFSAIIFWVWRNFGSWITTNMYAHNMRGLLDFYIAALPFLRNSIVGSCVWTAVIMTLFSTVELRVAREKISLATIFSRFH